MAKQDRLQDIGTSIVKSINHPENILEGIIEGALSFLFQGILSNISLAAAAIPMVGVQELIVESVIFFSIRSLMTGEGVSLTT